ncbi:MAG: glutamine synthetase family protein [Micrococcaceae bacterium]|nr:glutamine synthetase family protein [Micrococcaceae bacterium]
MTNTTDELIFLATTDIAAVTKGRAMRLADFNRDSSLGWVPANLGIGPFGHIAEGIPFGSSGDLRLKPDHSSLTRIDGIPNQPPVSIAFADIVETDGSPWKNCPRNFLRTVIEDLRTEYGLGVEAAFEHEFTDMSAPSTPTHPFSLAAFRDAEPIGSEVMATFARAGMDPECWLPEYGPHQYEVTVGRTDALAAADRAILVRDTVRAHYTARGRKISFSPVVTPGGDGTGVHVHFGLDDLDGNSLVFDGSQPGRVSELAAKFAAGIVRYAPAMAALYAPLLISYQRLIPNKWSTARAFLGLQNREALLRIAPTNEIDGRDPKSQLHFEFRGADIGANPWLLLGSILRAGLEGLRQNLDPAPVIEGDLDLDDKHSDLAELPASLDEALTALMADKTVSGWFPTEFLQTFLAIKRDEIAHLKDHSMTEQCEAYSNVY